MLTNISNAQDDNASDVVDTPRIEAPQISYDREETIEQSIADETEEALMNEALEQADWDQYNKFAEYEEFGRPLVLASTLVIGKPYPIVDIRKVKNDSVCFALWR